MAHIMNIRDFFAFLLGMLQSLFQLRHFKIDVVFCKGGYVALPVVLAARILRKRIIVHESDTHSGLVNKIATRFADKIFTGFDNVLPKSETVGQILSDDIAFGDDTNAIKNAKIGEILAKIPKKKTIVLVIGGSQGSYRLYKSLIHILDQDPATMSNFVFVLSL
jgi:UDP-N-acetylglucosamine--N-acetylmuramyl-(pentapeptide) pyrophosphoryl-undecaprenol N-acetylglucosamine transferase